MKRPALPALFGLLVLPHVAAAQSVVVDEGTFVITVAGRDVGTEEFTIRRAGLGTDATFIAYGVVTIDSGDGSRELRPLLRATPPDGLATGYELKVSGSETAELNLTLAGQRYVSVLRSERGEEEREFLARPETRVLEAWVAHQYYFLRNLREGGRAWAIEPRSRRQLQLSASAIADEELWLGSSRVPARKMTLTVADETRVIWFDRQGRVLRVEIPTLEYVAQREDLVG